MRSGERCFSPIHWEYGNAMILLVFSSISLISFASYYKFPYTNDTAAYPQQVLAKTKSRGDDDGFWKGWFVWTKLDRPGRSVQVV
ncbi:hypothetical protein KFK09_023853 [Dendrobium nobile]|uniref:Uncharacterized protein n=1 Tax=Dendrobium nobile TaxID=94219 RepID=A0A8T3AC87_DENNO|nr:hypothetical protein KFK09_023853 [Dendrobium nobile]